MEKMYLSSIRGLQDVAEFSKSFLDIYNLLHNSEPPVYRLIANSIKKEIKYGENFNVKRIHDPDELLKNYSVARQKVVLEYMQATVDFLEKTAVLKEQLWKDKGWK